MKSYLTTEKDPVLGVAGFSLPGGAPLGLGTQALRTEVEWKEVCVGEAGSGATVLPQKLACT